MPTQNQRPRQPLSKERLIARVKACTLKIGVAKRIGDESTANVLRERRALAARKLAERYNVWPLINTEGHTEFVDQPEWEQRMMAWARRNGFAPPARVRLSERRPTPGVPPSECLPPPPPPAGDAPGAPPSA